MMGRFVGAFLAAASWGLLEHATGDEIAATRAAAVSMLLTTSLESQYPLWVDIGEMLRGSTQRLTNAKRISGQQARGLCVRIVARPTSHAQSRASNPLPLAEEASLRACSCVNCWLGRNQRRCVRALAPSAVAMALSLDSGFRVRIHVAAA